MVAQFLWVIFPYLCLSVMVIGSLYRYAYRQMTWSARSSEILERDLLKWGSLLFHWGILLVIGGHVMGLLVPLAWYNALGISSNLYHQVADAMGGVSGLMAWLGLAILLWRRISRPRVRRNSSVSDFVALGLLFLVVSTGDGITLIYNHVIGPFAYRETVAPWLRGLLVLQPHAALMASTPWIFQLHIALSFLLFAAWPFTRLVHVFSAPVAYPRRAPIQYRSRRQYQPPQDANRRPGIRP